MSRIYYRTVIEESADELDEQVMQYLSEGWELYGSPYTVKDDGRDKYFFCQAVINREDAQ